MADGRELTGTYNEMWNDNPWSTGFRCKICPDAIGLHADLATGDFWDAAEPEGESPGENGIIAHTQIAVDILAACEAEGRLVLRDVPVDDLNRTQPHHQRLRQTWPARVAGSFVAGSPAPDFRNLSAAADTVPEAQMQDTFGGALTRARKSAPDQPQAFDDWAAASKSDET